MRSPKVPSEEQYCLVMECRTSGMSDYQWCEKNNIKPGTFYNWIRRLRQNGHTDIPSCTGRDSYKEAPKQEVVKIDFAEPSVQIPISEPSMESNHSYHPLKVTPSIMLTLGNCSMYISNEADPFLLAHTIKILKELSC